MLRLCLDNLCVCADLEKTSFVVKYQTNKVPRISQHFFFCGLKCSVCRCLFACLLSVVGVHLMTLLGLVV